MRISLQILVCSLAFFISSCNKEKLKAPVASYLRIDTALVSVTSTTMQGTTNNKITDIWVYVDQQFKGAYPLGHLIPIVSQGSTDVLIFPGIKNNGISATRMPYTFLQGLNVNLDLKAEETVQLKPSFVYRPGTVFHQIENFEGTGFAITTSTNSNISCVYLNKTTDPNADVFEGNGCLFMTMTDNQPMAEVRTSAQYALPLSGAAVYAELNYKTNQVINVGVYSGSVIRSSLDLNPTDGWNKVYIRLTDVVSAQPTYTNYGVYIRATKGVDSPQIYIDNFKLLSE